MKLLYDFKAEGVWFSKNGAKAYRRGEKPRFLWPDNADLVPTVSHHVATLMRSNDYSRNLVMFYKQASDPAYPSWICRPCGKKHGKKPKGQIGSWHAGTCGVCGKSADVTQPRDFGHLKAWPIKEEGEK